VGVRPPEEATRGTQEEKKMRRIFATALIGTVILATAATAADDYVVIPKSSRVFTPGACGFASQQSL
jgi:hypothetical protein